MKIAFLFTCHGNVKDFSGIAGGNPGIGGTEFLILYVAAELAAAYPSDEIVVYTNADCILPEGLEGRNAGDECGAVRRAEEEGADIFIFIARELPALFYECLETSSLRAVAWAHNYLSCRILTRLSGAERVRRVVFVGQQHYDGYIDDEIMKKSCFIYNTFPMPPRNGRERKAGLRNVAYVGALIPRKGFLVLAKAWKKVLKRVPDARLYVVGSGALYLDGALMGPWGLAEASFERKFLRYLTDRDGRLISSVTFCGRLGAEKREILERTSVGVANPCGKTETFCLSAAEFEAAGIPVVSYRGFGLLDTVADGKTGFLCRGSRETARRIVRLLENGEESARMGEAGSIYVRERFAPDRIIPRWHSLFEELLSGGEAAVDFSYRNFGNDLKFLKYANYRIQSRVHGCWKSVACLQSRLKETAKAGLKALKTAARRFSGRKAAGADTGEKL